MKTVVVPLVILTLTCACASQEQTVQRHEDAANRHEQQADEWRSAGIDVVAEYHEEKALREQQISVAASCGFFDVLFDILLSSDSCSTKQSNER